MDNTSQIITNHPKYHPQNFDKLQESISSLISKATQIAQDFEKKTNAAGGYLALTKCFWYLITWGCDPSGKAQMSPTTNLPEQISFTSGSNIDKNIYNF